MNVYSKASKLCQSLREEAENHITVHKKGFSGITDANPLSFRIDNDSNRRIDVCSRINIDMAVSRSRLDNRNG